MPSRVTEFTRRRLTNKRAEYDHVDGVDFYLISKTLLCPITYSSIVLATILVG